jgi:hypothetical protein
MHCERKWATLLLFAAYNLVPLMKIIIPSALLISLLSLGACTAPMAQRNSNAQPRTGSSEAGTKGALDRPASNNNNVSPGSGGSDGTPQGQ